MAKQVKKKKRVNKKRHALSPAKRIKRALAVTLKLALIVFSVPVLSYGGWRLYQELLVTSRLEIRKINVAGVERVKAEEIIRLASIEEGQNILSIDLFSGARAIETHPWIRTAIIRRHIPDTINIEITERKPLSLVSMDSLYVADERGVLFKKYSPEDELDLVLITGLEKGIIDGGYELAPEFVKLVEFLTRRDGFNINDLSEIHYDRVYGFSLYTLEGGIRLNLGTGRIGEKMSAFEDVVDNMGGSFMDIAGMDITNEFKVVVKYKTSLARKGGVRRYGKEG
ncbi:MAG: FtsQ-type POTRA domain-containing protein [Thermodesulfobacteriota bacterium]